MHCCSIAGSGSWFRPPLCTAALQLVKARHCALLPRHVRHIAVHCCCRHSHDDYTSGVALPRCGGMHCAILVCLLSTCSMVLPSSEVATSATSKSLPSMPNTEGIPDACSTRMASCPTVESLPIWNDHGLVDVST